MKEKILNKEGLKKLLEKLKERYAPLDSPKFRGRPTVETASIRLHSKGKEIVNREYVHNFVEMKIRTVAGEINQHFAQTIKPDDWMLKDNKYVNGRFSRFLGKLLQSDLNASVIVRLDTLKIDSLHLLDAHQNHPLGITPDGEIYIVGEKPDYDIPIVVDLFLSNDLTNFLINMEEHE